jgi:hypothetical protein
MLGDRLELVREPSRGASAPKSSQSLAKRLCDGLCFRLACAPSHLGGEAFGFGISDVESH